MTRKREDKRERAGGVELSPEEIQELEMNLDRLRAQAADGESLGSYLASLRKALEGRSRLVSALIDRLAGEPSAVGFLAFSQLQDLCPEKHHQRLLKRARYRFEQRGFATEDRQLASPRVVLIPREQRQPVVHVGAAREVSWFVLAWMPGEANSSPMLIWACVGPSFREAEIGAEECSSSRFREFAKEVATHFSARLFEAPVWHGARLLFEIGEFGEQPTETGLGAVARKRFRPFLDLGRPPYAHQLMPAVSQPDHGLDRLEVQELLAVPKAWLLMFSAEQLRFLVEGLQAADGSLLVVRKDLQEERRTELFRQAADELCEGKTRRIMQRYFEEEALLHRLAGANDLAETAWRVACHLSSTGRASDNPAVRNLLALSLRAHWPEEFAEPQGADAGLYRETESGLILPR